MKKNGMSAEWKELAMCCAVLGFAYSPALGQHESVFGSLDKKPESKASVVKVVPTRLDGLEFTGLLAVGSDVTFSLYDPETKQSVWVPLNGSDEGVSVGDFDEEGGTITVSLDGRSRSIVINENEIVTLKRAVPAKTTPQRPAVASNVAKAKPKKPVRVKDPKTLKKEEEARSFVSNLLSNSMQQRERYRKEREERLAKAKGGSN
ncbi:MAG: hypothetical protein ACJ07L_05195 [Opitutales bacterium]